MFGGLFGLRRGIMFANFHMAGIVLWSQEWLKISVSLSIAIGPRCFKWRFEMLSGPVDFEFLAFLICVFSCVGWKGG